MPWSRRRLGCPAGGIIIEGLAQADKGWRTGRNGMGKRMTVGTHGHMGNEDGDVVPCMQTRLHSPFVSVLRMRFFFPLAFMMVSYQFCTRHTDFTLTI